MRDLDATGLRNVQTGPVLLPGDRGYDKARRARGPHLDDPVYVDELHEEGSDGIRAAYGTETFARLQALERQYDPDNFFHLNQNIAPQTAHT